MKPAGRGALALLVAALLLGARPALPEAVACPDARFSVEAATPELRARVCARIDAARPALAACGLAQVRPITLRIVREIVSDPLGSDCIGLYDCTTDEIRLLHPEALHLSLSGETALARIPPDELFDSLVMHEIAHAFFAQTAVEGAAVPIANQEYVASAMQMASLTEDSRDAFLAAHPGPSTVRQAEINTLIALAAPTLFAAKAWRHFAEVGHGCAFVGRLIRGEVSFALPPL